MTIRELVEVISYDPWQGKFHWRRHKGTKREGKEAGYICPLGYRRIQINGKKYQASNLAIAISRGFWPKEVDHINGNRCDDRLVNLRTVTRRQNQQNRKEHREGRLPGTYIGKRSGNPVWRARIECDGTRTHLGTFPTEEEAHSAYMNAVKASRVTAPSD